MPTWTTQSDWTAAQSDTAVEYESAPGDVLPGEYDDFNDNTFDTTKWVKKFPGVAGSITEQNQRLELAGGGSDDDRPYVMSTQDYSDGATGSDLAIETVAKRTFDPAPGQVWILGWWDGNTSGAFATPTNSVALVMDRDGALEIEKREGGTQTTLASVSLGNDTTVHTYRLELLGTHASFNAKAYVDGSQQLSITGASFSPAAATGRVGLSCREFGADSWYLSVTVRSTSGSTTTSAKS